MISSISCDHFHFLQFCHLYMRQNPKILKMSHAARAQISIRTQLARSNHRADEFNRLRRTRPNIAFTLHIPYGRQKALMSFLAIAMSNPSFELSLNISRLIPG